MSENELKLVDTPTTNASSEYRPYRSLKMVEPICVKCQTVAGGPTVDWFKGCKHNPYVTVEDVPIDEPIIEENAAGERIFKGNTTRIVRKEAPNLRQVAYETRINSFKGLEWAKAAGYKLPEEMGLVPFCQYGDCWSQRITVHHPVYGDYCTKLHCKLVIADSTGTPLEVFDMEERQKQLNEIAT